MMHAVDDDHHHDAEEESSSSATPDRGPRHRSVEPAAPTPTRRSVRRSIPPPSPPPSAERRRVRRVPNMGGINGEEKSSPPPPTDAHHHHARRSSGGGAARRNAPLPSSSSFSTSSSNGIHASTTTTPQRRRGGDTNAQRRQLHRRSPSPRKSSPTPPILPTDTTSTPNRNQQHRRVHSSPGGSSGNHPNTGVQIQRTMKRRVNLARLCLGLAATLWVYAAASNYGMMRRMHDERRGRDGVESRGGGGADDDGVMGGVPRFRDRRRRSGSGDGDSKKRAAANVTYDDDGGVAREEDGASRSKSKAKAKAGGEHEVAEEVEEEPFVEVEVKPGSSSIPVFVPLPASTSDPESLTILTRVRDMIESSSQSPPSSGGRKKVKGKGGGLRMYAQGPSARREFLVRHGAECHLPKTTSPSKVENPMLERHDALPAAAVNGADGRGEEDWRLQLWKYCALHLYGGVYFDPSDATLLQPLGSIISATEGGGGIGGGLGGGMNVSVAVYNRARGLVHDTSLLALRRENGDVARSMLDRIMDLTSPLVPGGGGNSGDRDGNDGLELSRTLHDLVMVQIGQQSKSEGGGGGGGWTLLEQRCAAPPHPPRNDRHRRVLAEERYGTCDTSAGGETYCCHVLGPPVGGAAVGGGGGVAMLTRHFAALERSDHPGEVEADVESTVTRLVPLPVNVTSPTTTSLLPAELLAPNFHDVMLDADCLPNSNRHCLNCLESGGTCFPTHEGGGGVGVGRDDCTRVCGCYCSALCTVRPRPKPVIKEFTVVPPGVVGDGGVGGDEYGGRYIPRRVHQIWHEAISKKKYPQLSRITQSFRTQSGWRYDLHTHSAVSKFLREHFPPEVREAYDSLLPKRFRTDLARYCLLFVYGGVYADADVMLQANLDNAIDADVGFVGVLDQTFEEGRRPMCLSNSFLASSPGHPFLARAIELIVNNARNRFTAVDYDDMMCPSPKTNLTYRYSNQFTTGPCLLGAAVNDVLGRHMQTPFGPGDVAFAHGGYDNKGPRGSGVRRDGDEEASARRRLDAVPGRSVLLRPRLKDMGDLRFTLVDRSILVGTVMRRNLLEKRARPDDLLYKSVPQGRELRNGVVYGMEGVYRDDGVAAHEEVRFIFS